MNHEPSIPNDITRPFDKTQPMEDDDLVLYRCTCGTQLRLDSNVGGVCSKCDCIVSPKMLQHDLAMTMTIHLDANHDEDAQPTTGLSDTRAEITDDGDPLHLIGKTMGHFEIVEPLGRGGMGQVYRALDKSLQRYVAVKVLRSGIGSTNMSSTSSDEEIDELLQEAVSQARVTHPNIVTIYYVGKQDGDPFLAMELINGQPLSKLISSGTLTFSHIAPIAIQLVNALKFSYELDIIHGDIKPSNIMVQPNGLTKISDFGMARRASDETDGRLGGTPNYIAPELLTGGQPSIQSDMYALGVTLYEMTFGRLPVTLTGRTIREWIDSHQGTEVVFPNPWPENFPEAWRDLLVRLLAKEPEGRFETYEELATELEKLRPTTRVRARAIPRMIATGIDWALIFLLLAPMGIVASLLSEFGTSNQVLTALIHTTEFTALVLYSLLVFFWRQSPGRNLLHLRVVNQYGLKMSGKGMVLRDILRNILVWGICCANVLESFEAFWIGIAAAAILIAVNIFMLLDTGFMAFYDQGRSIHDIIFKSRVVLDTRSK